MNRSALVFFGGVVVVVVVVVDDILWGGPCEMPCCVEFLFGDIFSWK